MPIDYVICINHTIHLAILKTISKKNKELYEKYPELDVLLKKIRIVVNNFKKSAKLEQILEEIINKSEPGHKKRRLIIDCKTR